jgi:hypothetical protein
VLRYLLIAVAAPAIMLAAAPAAGAAEADFSWSPDPPVVRQEATFTAVQDPSIAVYRWDLDGNGRYDDRADASGPQVGRTFQSVRTYQIGLVTVDNNSHVSERRREVTVVGPGGGPNRPPEASFVFFPANPVAGEPITFVSTSTDPDSPIPASGLAWDLNGDGAFDDAAGSTATTAYPAAGMYTISLRITTNSTDVATLVLNVGTPGAPGAGVGQRSLSLLSPFPVVRIAGRVSRRGARIRRLTINAPPGTGIKVRCNGRGCPFKRVLHTISARTVGGRALPPTRLLRVRRLEGALLRPGVTLRLFATRSGAVGKYTRFRILKDKPPSRTDMCLVPGNGRPLSCPSR